LYDGVVVCVGASQDQFMSGINEDFVVVFEESEEHFEWNIDIKIAICVGLPSRFLRMVLAVSNVLTALIFSNSRNFETEGDTTRKLKPN